MKIGRRSGNRQALTCSPTELHLKCPIKQTSKQIEQPITWLTGLSSLSLVVVMESPDMDDLPGALLSATAILECVETARLKDVRVAFEVDPIASMGAPLSGASAPSLEACKQFETILLSFSNSSVVVRDPVYRRRAGRTDFWSPIIRRAFPRLDARGLLALEFTHPCKPNSVHFHHHRVLIHSRPSRKRLPGPGRP